MNTENLPPTIEDSPLRGVTLRILISIVVSTAITVSSVMAGYYGIKGKDDVQDLQLETIKLQIEKINIDLHELRLDLNNKKDKSEK